MAEWLEQICSRYSKNKIALILLVLSIVLIVYYKSGIRITPEAAMKASPFIEHITEVIKKIGVEGGMVYIVDTPEAFRTVYVEAYGALWVSRYASFVDKEQVKDDKIKTVGAISYSKSNQQQIQLLGIWNEDTEVEAIQITRENGDVHTQVALMNELNLFRWNDVDNLNTISILALDGEGHPIYYYGYPEGENVFSDSAFKWNPVIGND